VAASAPENETTYPYPSGTKVATLNPNRNSSVAQTFSAGLYGIYMYAEDDSYWKVIRFPSSWTGTARADEAFLYFNDTLGLTGLNAEFVSERHVEIYYIKD
jgi:hypothetical protein